MRDEAREVLNKKVAEIKEDFEKWLMEKNILLLGEIAVISIHIGKTPIVTTKITRGGRRLLKYSSKELQQEDWDKILSVPFSKRELAILEMIRQNGNQPTSCEKIRAELLKQFGHRGDGIYDGALNIRFSTRNLPYRLKECGKSFMKLFIVEL